MKHRYNVSGNVTAVVHTVIESDRKLTEEEVYEQATREFAGISQFVGNGGCGERLLVSTARMTRSTSMSHLLSMTTTRR